MRGTTRETAATVPDTGAKGGARPDRVGDAAVWGPPEAQSGALSPADLGAMAAEIAHIPETPETDELVLLPVDPGRLHAYWHIGPATLERARELLGAGAQREALLLRLYEDGSPRFFDVELQQEPGRCYLELKVPAARYHAALYLGGDDGRILTLALAAPVEMPHSAGPEAGPAGDKAMGFPLADWKDQKPVAEPTSAECAEPPAHGTLPDRQVETGGRIPFGARAERELAETLASGTLPLPPVFPDIGQARATPGAPGVHAPAARYTWEEGQPPSPVQSHTEAGMAPWGVSHPGSRAATGPVLSGQSGVVLADPYQPLSSFVLGRRRAPEIHAEIRVFGYCPLGQTLTLFGEGVPVRPDGTFSMTRGLSDEALARFLDTGGEGPVTLPEGKR